MSKGFLLDTDILSEPLRPAPDPALMLKLEEHDSELATASVVWHELVLGCRRLPPSRKRRAIETYLREVVEATIPILPYDGSAATWHAEERARLARIGAVPSFVDGQIAAIARVHDLVLVTSNTAHFTTFSGLRVVDWRAR
ncbi:MAG: type II toxin-antitoxin system VapC family toxin [Thermoanaerobaculaceae bacterium]|nr:type II toxin-antitoxin system VapC family toxin [Thermoanaerobaculaceae bacterium]